MKKNIRDNIFSAEIFNPCSNTGYYIGAFLKHSIDILEIPIDEIVNELSKMEAEGLVLLENGAYRSTKLGQIAKQKILALSYELSHPLKNQKQYELEDLILAIVASHSIDPWCSYEVINKDELEIYLHEFPMHRIKETTESLIQLNYLENYDLYPENSVNITAIGLQKYFMEARGRLNLPRDESILNPSTELVKDDRFDKLGFDEKFSENIQQRWSEMGICANSGAYLAAVILLGSILEGALLAKLQIDIKNAMTAQKSPKIGKTDSIKPLEEWSLQDYIAVSVELNHIPKSVEKHLHELRDTRNLVHPNKQINSNIIVDESLYRISREVAETVIDALVI